MPFRRKLDTGVVAQWTQKDYQKTKKEGKYNLMILPNICKISSVSIKRANEYSRIL